MPSLIDRALSWFRSPVPPHRGPFSDVRALATELPAYQLGKATWPAWDVAAYRTDAYQKVATVYACANVQAAAVAAAPVKVYSQEAGGQLTEIPDHPVRQLLRTPNPFMSEFEFLSLSWLMAAIAGFCVVEKVRARAGNVVELWPLRSDWLKPVPRGEGRYDWEYRVPGYAKPERLRWEDSIVFTYGPDLCLSPTGLAPLAVIGRQVAVEAAMTDFIKILFERGAVPQLALIPREDVRKMAPDQIAALKAAFVERFGGYSRWSEPAILAQIERIDKVGLDFNELAWPELHAATQLDICNAFGVPPQIVGIKIALEVGAYENYATARKQFYQDTIRPIWARLDGALSRGLLPEFETRNNVQLEFDPTDVPALQEDVTPVWTRATAAWTAGVVMLDEARSELGLPALPNKKGEVFRTQLGAELVPIERLGEEPEPLPLPSGQEDDDAVGGNGARVRPGRNGHVHRDRDPGGDQRLVPTVRILYPLSPEQRASYVDTSRTAMARLSDAGARKLRAFWREQGQRIAAAAKRGSVVFDSVGAPDDVRRPDLATRDLAEIDWADELRRLTNLLVGYHATVGETAFALVGQRVGVDLAFDVANPYVSQVLGKLATRIVGIHDTTRDDVRRVVADALDEGVGVDRLALRLSTMFEQTYRGRAETVARTEAQVAWNKASVAGYQQSGVVSAVELADNPNHVDAYGASDGLSCAQRNGIVVDLERVESHIDAEHPNGSLAVLPVLSNPVGG